jgi:hypothetical protein
MFVLSDFITSSFQGAVAPGFHLPPTVISRVFHLVIGHREREQDYGYLQVSYWHYVALGLEEVYCLVRTVTDELGLCHLSFPLFQPCH